MTRVELYHKPKHVRQNRKLLGLIWLAIAVAVMFSFTYYYQKSIRIDSHGENFGRKVIVHLPNGDDVFTYDKLIVEKDGKTYYKGEWNKIDLTGGTIEYKNWK